MTDVPFDAWARFYDDALPADRPDRPFFVDCCRDAGAVLELGCGTGEIYLDLLAAGVDAYGIDLSAEMLAVLRRKAADRGLDPRVVQANVTSFAAVFDVTFDVVIGPLNVVRHVTSLRDQRAVFRNAAESLGEGGRFVFWVDLPDVDALCDQRDGSTTTRTFTHEGRRYDLDVTVELADRLDLTVAYTFTYTDRESGDVVETMTFEMSVVPKAQFELLLDDAGFAEWTFSNGPALDPLSTPTEPVVCIARR